jgi:hypothetical protein
MCLLFLSRNIEERNGRGQSVGSAERDGRCCGATSSRASAVCLPRTRFCIAVSLHFCGLFFV